MNPTTNICHNHEDDHVCLETEIREEINNPEKFNALINELIPLVDDDNNLKLDKAELKVVLEEFCKLLGIPLPRQSDVDDIFTGHDLDGCGFLTRDELCVLIRRLFEQILLACKPEN